MSFLESSTNQSEKNFNDLVNNWSELKQKEYVNSSTTSINLFNNNFTIGNNTGINRFKDDYSFQIWDKHVIEKLQEIILDLVLDTWRINKYS